MEEEQSVRFTLEQRDYAAMAAHLCAPVVARSKSSSRALSVAGVLIGSLFAFRYVDSFGSFALGLLFAAGLFMVVIKLSVAGVRKEMQPTAGGSILCEYDVALTPDGVDTRTPHWHTLHRWSGVIAIDQVPEYAFVRIDAVAAYAIPKRAFADDLAFQRFVDAARAHLQAPKV